MFHMLRRGTQWITILLILVIPWLNILRFDFVQNKIILLGLASDLDTSKGLQFTLLFLVLFAFAVVLSFYKGRVFCGWSCPYGSLIEFSDAVSTLFNKGRNRWVAGFISRSRIHKLSLRVIFCLLVICIPHIIALSLAAYFVDPVLIKNLFLSIPGTYSDPLLQTLMYWSCFFSAIFYAAGFLIKHNFCRILCIYGMGQSMVAETRESNKILRPRFTPETLDACGNCQACLNACIVDLDPRAQQLNVGFGSGCFNCGDCLDICTIVQQHKYQPSLITFESRF